MNKNGKKPKDLGVKALDDYTLQVELTKPIPYFQQMLAFGTFMPQNEKVVKNMANLMVQPLIKLYIMVLLKLISGL